MNNTDSPTTHVGKVTEMEVTTELEQETDRSVYSLQVGKSPITTILVDFWSFWDLTPNVKLLKTTVLEPTQRYGAPSNRGKVPQLELWIFGGAV